MAEQKKIKVLFRHRSMEMGGVEKVLLGMLNHLDKAKFDLSLSLNLFQGELRNAVPKDIPFTTLAGGKEDFPKNPILNKVAYIFRGLKLKIYKTFPIIADSLIIHNQADIEVATGYTMFEDVLNSSNKKSKKIGWLHSDLTTKGFDGVREKILNQISQFDYFIFGSQQAKDTIDTHFPTLKLPPHAVILNAIPIEEIKAKAEEFPVDRTSKPLFVSVGRLHNRKGYHLLAQAHKNLLDKGFEHEIRIVGDGEERENLEKQIADLGIGDSFKLLGTLLNPYPFVRNADFYIMPSRSEGWPLIIAETLILQKPIIATNVGGIPEMIVHQKNGYLVDYDLTSIENGMETFLTNQTLVNAIKNELKTIEQQFDERKIYNAVEEILTNLQP